MLPRTSDPLADAIASASRTVARLSAELRQRRADDRRKQRELDAAVKAETALIQQAQEVKSNGK